MLSRGILRSLSFGSEVVCLLADAQAEGVPEDEAGGGQAGGGRPGGHPRARPAASAHL